MAKWITRADHSSSLMGTSIWNDAHAPSHIHKHKHPSFTVPLPLIPLPLSDEKGILQRTWPSKRRHGSQVHALTTHLTLPSTETRPKTSVIAQEQKAVTGQPGGSTWGNCTMWVISISQLEMVGKPMVHFDGTSNAFAMEIPQSWTKPSNCNNCVGRNTFGYRCWVMGHDVKMNVADISIAEISIHPIVIGTITFPYHNGDEQFQITHITIQRNVFQKNI